MKFTFQCFLQAAGSADDFLPLDDYDKVQRTTAKVMQRTLVFILPLVFISFMLGSLAEYEQVSFTNMVFEVFERCLFENDFKMVDSRIAFVE
jgi:hypothetical protein